MHREITGDLVLISGDLLHRFAHEADLRVLLHVEEVFVPEMLGALFIPRIDAGRLNHGLDLRIFEVLGLAGR